MLTAYGWMDRFGVLPSRGGMLDQSPLFVEAVRVIEAERGRLEEERRRALEDKNKSSQGQQRHGRRG